VRTGRKVRPQITRIDYGSAQIGLLINIIWKFQMELPEN
jgi:hypothetical protein